MNKFILVLIVLLLMTGSALTGYTVFSKIFSITPVDTKVVHKINVYDYTQNVCEVSYLDTTKE